MLTALVILSAVFAATGFGGDSGASRPMARSSVGGFPLTSALPGESLNHPATLLSPVQHVFVIYLENQDLSSVQSNGPFEIHLANTYAAATNYYAPCHPSAPNYLASTSGTTWQCGSDNYNTYTTENIFDLAQRAGLSWDDFSESMPSACYTSDTFPSGLYVAHHNPAIYYSDIAGNRSLCDAHDLPFSAWYNDVNNSTIPNFAFFAPNMDNDGHQTGTAYADKWLSGWLSPYLNASWFATSVWFVTWDEGTSNSGINGTSGGGHLYFAAVSQFSLGGRLWSNATSHYGLLATEEWLLGLPVGGCGHNDGLAANPPMKGIFNLSGLVPPLKVTVSANTTTGVAPLEVAFSSTVSGGLAPYSYTWNFQDGGTSALADPVHTFASFGTYAVTVAVTDLLNQSGRGGTTLHVASNSTALEASIVGVPDAGAIPLRDQFNSTISGGIGPYTLAWSFGDGGVGNGAAPVHWFNASGNYTVTATVRDSGTNVTQASAEVEAFLPFSVDLAASARTVETGGQVRLTATVIGGSGEGVTFAWAENGLVVQGAGHFLSVRPNHTGTMLIGVTAHDSVGDEANASAVVTVTAVTPTPPSPRGSVASSLPTVVIASVVVIAAAGAAGLGIVFWLRRRR